MILAGSKWFNKHTLLFCQKKFFLIAEKYLSTWSIIFEEHLIAVSWYYRRSPMMHTSQHFPEWGLNQGSHLVKSMTYLWNYRDGVLWSLQLNSNSAWYSQMLIHLLIRHTGGRMELSTIKSCTRDTMHTWLIMTWNHCAISFRSHWSSTRLMLSEWQINKQNHYHS